MPSSLARSVSRIGFRKWYERQLLKSHGHLVLGFLAAIGVVGSVEDFSRHESDPALLTLLILACASIGAWAMNRYSAILLRAEEAANQANCPHCGEYGRFRVVAEGGGRLDVCCRKCDKGWSIQGD
ncbi:hypothetical protein [Ramlibacter sp.]|uniref:hypothetical protein n=1 Tax=Ramlibacter sp. TaxID=1917967 RepID=UPI003D0F867E